MEALLMQYYLMIFLAQKNEGSLRFCIADNTRQQIKLKAKNNGFIWNKILHKTPINKRLCVTSSSSYQSS